MYLPQGRPRRVALIGNAIYARCVARIKHKLSGDANFRVHVSYRLDICFGPPAWAMVWNHFHNHAGAFGIVRVLYDRDVDVVVFGLIWDLVPAVDALGTLLARDPHESLQHHFAAFAKRDEVAAVSGRTGGGRKWMVVRAPKGNRGILLDLRLQLQHFRNGDRLSRAGGTEVIL